MFNRILKNSLIFTGIIVVALLFHVLLLDREEFFKIQKETSYQAQVSSSTPCFEFPC